ncbi:MAG: prephenate dehydrogenase/arogenate dehydrogenase family protein [Chloroflexota bacterium]|nr:MAG: prephenate dehydrogenase/arogenate dehydrogenase family protein [Chloroflexota bacterium]
MKPRLTIIGLGKTGTSIGLALKKAAAELEIIGHDKSRDAMNAAQKAGAVDKNEWNLYDACEGAGLIVLAMPLAGVLETIHLLKEDLVSGVILTDTATVKMPVLKAAKELKPGVHFVGGNPVFRPAPDGTLLQGEASADYFQNAVYCLTPTLESSPDAVQVMTGFVSMLGAKPLFLDPAEHDGLAAGAEHLAVLAETALLKTVTASSGWRELNKFAGVDFFRATELATRQAESAAQLLLAQRDALQLWIDLYVQSLRELKQLLAQNDAAAIEKWIASAQEGRTQWLKNEVGGPLVTTDYSEVRAGAARLFLGGLATRLGGDKKK